MPRVALMFLTRAGLPYEQLWAEWLASAAGLLPAQHIQVCGSSAFYPITWVNPSTQNKSRSFCRCHFHGVDDECHVPGALSGTFRYMPVTCLTVVLRTSAKAGRGRLHSSTNHAGHLRTSTFVNSRRPTHAQGPECGSGRIRAIRSSCRAPSSALLVDRQILFTVYNHPRPSYLGFPSDSIFAGREVANRIPVSVELLMAALVHGRPSA